MAAMHRQDLQIINKKLRPSLLFMIVAIRELSDKDRFLIIVAAIKI